MFFPHLMSNLELPFETIPHRASSCRSRQRNGNSVTAWAYSSGRQYLHAPENGPERGLCQNVPCDPSSAAQGPLGHLKSDQLEAVQRKAWPTKSTKESPNPFPFPDTDLKDCLSFHHTRPRHVKHGRTCGDGSCQSLGSLRGTHAASPFEPHGGTTRRENIGTSVEMALFCGGL